MAGRPPTSFVLCHTGKSRVARCAVHKLEARPGRLNLDITGVWNWFEPRPRGRAAAVGAPIPEGLMQDSHGVVTSATLKGTGATDHPGFHTGDWIGPQPTALIPLRASIPLRGSSPRRWSALPQCEFRLPSPAHRSLAATCLCPTPQPPAAIASRSRLVSSSTRSASPPQLAVPSALRSPAQCTR